MPFRDTALAIDMNFESIEGIIGDRGDSFIHEMSVKCPCTTTDTKKGLANHADPTCTSCRGRGILYRDPVMIDGLLSSLSSNRLWASVGWVQPGDLSFTPSTHAREISNADRITLTVPFPVDSQLIVRGKEAAFSPRSSDLRASEDYLYWEAGDEGAMWVEDEDGVTYTLGQYRLIGRKIRWIGGFGPAVGKKYTIKYRAFIEFLAWNGPFETFDRGRQVGQRLLLRKAVLSLNPGNQEIIAPWEERVGDNIRGYSDPYSLLQSEFENSTYPPR